MTDVTGSRPSSAMRPASEPLTRHVTLAVAALAMYSAFAAWMLHGAGQAPSLSLAAGNVSFVVLAAYFTLRRPNVSLATCCVVGAGFGATWQIMVLGYAVHHYGRNAALIDPLLHTCDAALGFDWTVLLPIFDARPRLTAVLGTLYSQCYLEMYVAALSAMLWRQQLRLLMMIAANFIVLVLVHCCAIIMPAIGVYRFLNLSPAMHPHISLVTGDHLVAEIMRMRESVTLAIPEHPLGLVNFPSYHTAVAVLFGWFFWKTPLRWPAVLVNAALLVATLLHGSHYLTDVIAGAALTGIVLAASGRWLAGPAATSPSWSRRLVTQPA